MKEKEIKDLYIDITDSLKRIARGLADLSAKV